MGDYSWPMTNAGETAWLPCSQKDPNLEGKITLLCTLAGEWDGSPVEDCTEKEPEVEPGTFTYSNQNVMTVKHEPIESMTPTIPQGTYSFSSKPCRRERGEMRRSLARWNHSE